MKLKVLFLLYLIVHTASAQSLSYLGIEHGLSNNTVNDLFKDKYGFMWFATDDGLNRYDGYEFIVYRNKLGDTTSLIHNQLNKVAEETTGNLWIGTKKGLCLFDRKNEQFSPAYFYPAHQKERKKILSDILEVAIGKDERVYVATSGDGLLTKKKGEHYFRQIPLPPGSDQKKSYSVNSLHITSQGSVWAVVRDRGLYLLTPDKGTFELMTSSITSSNALLAMGNYVWIGTDSGLLQYNTTTGNLSRSESGKANWCNSRVTDLNNSEANKLWIATDGAGISILDLQTDQITVLQYSPGTSSLSSNAITSLQKENDFRWWIGTQRGGVNVLDQKKDRFTTIRRDLLRPNSLIDNFTLSFCEDFDRSIWIGTDGGGISLWNREKNSYQNFRHQAESPNTLSNNNATSIIRDFENNIWISTWGGSISKYNREKANFSRYTCGSDKYIWKLYEDRQHNLWAGTVEGGGLYRYNRTNDEFEVFDPTLVQIISIMEDRSGTLWLGNFGQLIKVGNQKGKHKRYDINYPLRDLFQDKSGNIWIGTQGHGLLLFDPEKETFKAYTEAEGIANNSILNIEEDQQGNLWISTYHGISVFNPATEQFKNFYESDGLQSNQFNYNASLALSTGELLFGGIKGFNIFHPDSVQVETPFPKLVITDVRLFNKPLLATDPLLSPGQSLHTLKQLTLPYDQTFISVNFSALEYASPENIQYAYLLDGWDTDWNYNGNLRTANYSRLKEGDYTLRIKTTNASGTWNNEEYTIQLKVLPPWYRTWWAYVLYTCLGTGLLYLYNLYKTKQARLKYEVEIARIKAEKETELNEKKLSFFTNISHEFRTPLTLIINPVRQLLDKHRQLDDVQDLNTIHRNARRLLSLVDQLLLFRKADSGKDVVKATQLNIAGLCEEVFLSFSYQARSKGIAYTFHCENKELALFADREKMETAIFNLLSNAFKFTKSGAISLSVAEADNQVLIEVTDTGCGIPETAGSKLFDKFNQVHDPGSSGSGFGIGLYLVKKFVEGHQGQISYESEPGKGTTFRMLLPQGAEHFNEHSVAEPQRQHSELLEELLERTEQDKELAEASAANQPAPLGTLLSEKGSMLLVEDNLEIRQYVRQLFNQEFIIFEAGNGITGFEMALEHMPDIIISDIMMEGMDGVELCSKIKKHASLNHIPVILLTATSSSEIRLKGVEGGADDYITKPFEKELLMARVNSLLKSRDNLQHFFYNEVTLKPNNLKISPEYSLFFETCVQTIERHLEDPDFTVKVFAREMGMSHSNLYKRVKDISGRSVNDFIRFIRLRKVAKMLIDTDCKVNEAAFQAGFNDIKYFREQFQKLYGVNPSEYIKRYRKPFNLNKGNQLHEKVVKSV